MSSKKSDRMTISERWVSFSASWSRILPVLVFFRRGISVSSWVIIRHCDAALLGLWYFLSSLSKTARPAASACWIAMYDSDAAIAVAWSYLDHGVPSSALMEENPIDSDASTTQ